MGNWPGPITAITLFAEDLARTKAFYREVFGLPVHYEDDVSAVFRFETTLINLLDAREGPELVGTGRDRAAPGGGPVPVHARRR